MPSSRPVGRAGRSFAGGALGAALGCAFFAAGRCLGGACFGRATCLGVGAGFGRTTGSGSGGAGTGSGAAMRSEEHTSELQSLMRISYAVFCLKKKNTTHEQTQNHTNNLHRERVAPNDLEHE